MKWLGYLLIMASCFGLGEMAVGKLKDRRRALKRLLAWLSYFRGKILFEHAAMEEALRESAGEAGVVFSPFFDAVATELEKKSGRCFRQIWETQAEQREKEFFLSKEEFTDLVRFGGQLGEMDVEVQKRAIQRYEDELRRSLDKAEEEVNRKERLYRSLSVLAGCFIIILIW